MLIYIKPIKHVSGSSSISFISGTDLYWSGFTKSLNHFEGTNGSNTLKDESVATGWSSNNTISNAKAKFGATSLSMTSNSNTSLAAFNTTSDFTIEFFIYPTSVTQSNAIIISSVGTMVFGIGLSNGSLGYLTTDSNISTFGTNSGVTLNAWNHIVVQRAGSTLSAYVNGIACSTTYSFSTTIVNTSNNSIALGNSGAYTSPAATMTGFMDDFRVTIGVARYVRSTFTVPTSAYANGVSTFPACYHQSIGTANNTNLDSLTTTDTSHVFTASATNSISYKGAMSDYGTGVGAGYSTDVFSQNTGNAAYLLSEAKEDLKIGDNDFIARFWFYLNGSAFTGTYTYSELFQIGDYRMPSAVDTLTNSIAIVGTVGNTSIGVLRTDAINVVTMGNATPNAWNFVQISRVGTTTYASLNLNNAIILADYTSNTICNSGKIGLLGNSVYPSNVNVYMGAFAINMGGKGGSLSALPNMSQFYDLGRAQSFSTTLGTASGRTISNNNFDAQMSGSAVALGALPCRAGKLYFEVSVISWCGSSSNRSGQIGVALSNATVTGNSTSSTSAYCVEFYTSQSYSGYLRDGTTQYGNVQVPSSATQSIIGVKVDMVNNQISFTINGTDAGVAYTLPARTANITSWLRPYYGAGHAVYNDNCKAHFNFGQDGFVYLPSGYTGFYYT